MGAVADLKEEQLILGKKNVESDLLRRESMNLDMEGRKLREDWDDKVYKLRKAEEARDHYKAELNKLAQQYGDLVEKLSFVVMDYQVRTSATQVRGADGKHELLSSYLNRIYDEQEMANSKYAKIGAINTARLSGSDAHSPAHLAGHLSPGRTALLSPGNDAQDAHFVEQLEVSDMGTVSANGRVQPKAT